MIAEILPASGPSAGHTRVTLLGDHFQPGAKIRFGALPALAVNVISDNRIECETPESPGGSVDIILTNPDEQEDTADGGFTFLACPSISGITPSGGPAAGGTSVSLSGSGFSAGAAVFFGVEAAATVEVTSPSTITCMTPANGLGPCDVSVRNSDGQFAVLEDGYTFHSAPRALSLSPSTGPSIGGTPVTIEGAGFLAGASVRFRETDATDVVVVSPNRITCVSPAASPDLADVFVENPNGQVALPLSFFYVYPPEIASISPPCGHIGGGDVVVVNGSFFQEGATVEFGGNSATSVSVLSPTQIQCTTPPHAYGSVDVRVDNPDAQFAVKNEGFTFFFEWAVTSNPTSNLDKPLDLAIDSNWIYIAGHPNRIEKRSIRDGSLDEGFGSNGVVTCTTNPNSIAIDGHYLYVGGGPEWNIEKRNKSDGTLVVGFGSGGIVIANPGPIGDSVSSITLDSQHIYICGNESIHVVSMYWRQWRIEKRDVSSGTLDASFGNNGFINVYSSNNCVIHDSTIKNNNLFVLGHKGHCGPIPPYMWNLEKRSISSGALDSQFGSGGEISGMWTANHSSLAIFGSMFWVTGIEYRDFTSDDDRWKIEKRDCGTGSYDCDFGDSGVIISDPSENDEGSCCVLATENYTYICGHDGSLGNYQWRIEKRGCNDGLLENDFGLSGIKLINPSSGDDRPTCMSLDLSALYVVGYDSSSGDGQWRIEKVSR